MTDAQELALYKIVFSAPHHRRKLELAKRIIEQGGPLTPDYKEYRTSLRLCNRMLEDQRLGEVLDGRTARRAGDHASTQPMTNKGPF